MTASHSIPEVGEFGSADRVPGKRQLAHITVGPATTNDVVLTSTGVYALLSNKLSTDEQLAIFGLWTRVETPFTAAVTLDIGDSDNAERFSGSATIAATTSGAVLVASTGLSVPYIYSAPQDINVDVEAAIPAVGLLHVYVDYAILDD